MLGAFDTLYRGRLGLVFCRVFDLLRLSALHVFSSFDVVRPWGPEEMTADKGLKNDR